MVNYYDILQVKRTASAAEIKSAYRKLARERHPDLNGGTERAAREFALVSRAYRTLSNPQERAYHDSQLRRAQSGDFGGGSVFYTNNLHAQRLRRIAIQRQLFGRAALITLSVIGLWHLAVRLKAVFEHYTYDPKSIHDSITGEGESFPDKPFTRFAASTFLILAPVVSIAVGQHFTYDLLFYPPIAVLIVDTLHNVASKID